MKFFRDFLKKIVKRDTITHLGRWDHRISEDKKFIRATYANIDNCGDKICGQPELTNRESASPYKTLR